MRNFRPLSAFLLLAACGPFPADTGGTSERIERTRIVRIGLTDIHPGDAPDARAFIDSLSQKLNARAETRTGPAERELAALEAGDIDLVLGEFSSDSPWLAHVALIEPISTRRVGDHEMGLAPVVANGENRFVGMVEAVVRDMAERP